MRERVTNKAPEQEDYFTQYSCSGHFIEAAFKAKETTDSFEIPHERVSELMLEYELDPFEVVALAETASARAETMTRDLGKAVLHLEHMANEGY